METTIIDTRTIDELKTITFSKYKKTDVQRQLIESLRLSKIETACFWSTEMICSGYFAELWELILHFFAKYIHIGNHKCCILLSKRLQHFKTLFNATIDENADVLELRNQPVVRQLMAEVITVLCMSKKKYIFERVQIHSNHFNVLEIKERILAPPQNTYFVIDSEDTPELFLPLNELGYCIVQKNTQNAQFWIEWIMGYEYYTLKTKTVHFFRVKPREKYCPHKRYHRDVVWLIWECLETFVPDNQPYLKEIVLATLCLFTFRYTTGAGRKRIFLLFFVCAMLTEHVDLHDNLIDKTLEPILIKVKTNINTLYNQVNKNTIITPTC